MTKIIRKKKINLIKNSSLSLFNAGKFESRTLKRRKQKTTKSFLQNFYYFSSKF
jgi:hypothetical protein